MRQTEMESIGERGPCVCGGGGSGAVLLDEMAAVVECGWETEQGSLEALCSVLFPSLALLGTPIYSPMWAWGCQGPG